MRGEFQRRSIFVKTELDDRLAPVTANHGQVRQVFFNLVTNAVEAMDTVTDRSRMMLISSARNGNGEIGVAVEDSGTGIDPEHIEQIFSSFFTTKAEGMGMGLSICRSIIEAHGGRLWAAPGQPHGAIFRFTLPG
jgi:signal transduction histidine kinase